MRILLVDDSDSVRLTLGAILEDAGHVVVEAASLTAARRHLHEPFDLVLLDVHLGDDLGPSLIPEVRAALPAAKIGLLTGAPERMAGADAVFVKGDDPVRLLDQIERLVLRAPA
jgi:DNA-binding response OmpR family regulator